MSRCSCDLFSCTCVADPEPPKTRRKAPVNPALPTINPKAPLLFESVDPGVTYYAAACWVDGSLESVALRGISIHPFFPAFVVIEVPQIYDARAGGTGARVRKSDVADTLFAAGRIADRYQNAVKVTPAQWKGQLDKKTDHERTMKALTPDERLLLDNLSKADKGHVMDAIGIGLNYLWRR